VKLKSQHIGNLYYKTFNTKKEHVKNVNRQNIDNSQLKLWHNKLGHLNAKNLINLIKHREITACLSKKD